jgi:UDP-N-acetylmuramoyl-L-alanyl-D-glutamate--2,6-diaminopimelate ligase
MTPGGADRAAAVQNGTFEAVTSPQGRMRPRNRPARHLGDLATEFGLEPVDGPDVTLTGVAVGSADVQPGDLFVALPGLRAHGADYAAAAVAAGAVAVLTDPSGAARVGVGVPVLVAPQPRALLGAVSAWLYGRPAQALTVVGVTGTNGKTTTCYFLASALERVHPVTGVLGTVELRVGDETIESPRTTVEAPVLHGLFALMAERGATACAMEVSSHALALDRVGGVEFDVVGFTNLQRDHLDFHGDMEGYFADKARLFVPGRARRAVVCVDDEWGVRLAESLEIPVDTVATRADSAGSATAAWRVSDATIGLDGVGSTFTLTGPGVSIAAASPLPGLVNVSNAALAVVLAHRAGVPIEEAVAGVAGADAIPGRMERVVERGPGQALLLVDYAHTPDALTLALEAVRPITPGRLILVFGSDGDRDQGKRPIMGEIAARLADVLVVTDENPRSEEPAAIRGSILAGAAAARPDGRDVHEVEPRSEALRLAVEMAIEGDTVIVTGKGHEPTQEVAGVFHRYNDRDAYRAAVAQRWQVTERPDGITVVDSARAATIDSTRTALRDLVRLAAPRRTIAVVGMPDDAGAPGVADLDELGRLAVRLGIDQLIVVGDAARAVHTGAVQEGSFDGESHLVPDADAAAQWLRGHLVAGDVVLVKGSRTAGLRTVVEAVTP